MSTWIAPWLRQTVTVSRARLTRDRYGTDVLDWDNPAQTTHIGLVQPRTGVEDTAEVQVVVETAVAFLPYDADVRTTDRLTVEGRDYAVTAVIPRSFAGRHHLEVLVRRELGVTQ